MTTELFRSLARTVRESRRKRNVSFRREWTVNYGRYCPPVNNSPPHYMWELLTLDRLDNSFFLFLSLSFFLHTRMRITSSPPLYFHISGLSPSFFLPESIWTERSYVWCILTLSFFLRRSLHFYFLRDILDRTRPFEHSRSHVSPLVLRNGYDRSLVVKRSYRRR